MYIYQEIERRPARYAIAGFLCILVVDILRATFSFETGRIPLNVLAGSGQIVGLLALGELIYQMRYKNLRISPLRLSGIAMVAFVALLLVVARHGSELLKFGSVF